MRVTRESELADVVREATGPLQSIGGGTRPVGQGGGTALQVAISGISLYEPGALTLIAGAGTPLRVIEDAVAAEGQRLPFEPAAWNALLGTTGESTIGGVVAANVSGPRRIQAGACRDSLIGVRFVDGTGAVVKNGGRVMKNVTGYDLVKLMAGSWGTLGVLSEVAFKLLPAAPAQATLVMDVPLAQAAKVLSQALGSQFDTSGAGWLPGVGVIVRLEGLADSVAYRAGKLAEVLAAYAPKILRDEGAALWRDLAEVKPLQGARGDLWRFSVKPSEGPEIAARLGGKVVLDWGGGLVWARVAEGTDARALAAPYTGHATCLSGAFAAFEPEPAPVAALSRGLRARFDPKGLFNPGKMG
ncbi:glycolate oxidase FAD binding subunit [Rhodobacter aestuarii]|uniref:Glycolate oxidase FAD binding subunit n=1 Tax=Rhodobacter aestuarii TaxID=453582 RepID=A0A1N7MR07_9RHOB|nr:FAD-binding protein [Rhodobacter aestuarii]PTV96598.1 glycolate oxidase FAD binding subunit [Rhodobacter aestuarii]SIS88490.1 glycolate oxidase FAD binding subunit [Rhodobacter aestuarii]